jgi:hypothetical protein
MSYRTQKMCTSDGKDLCQLKVGTPIELTGLQAKPELKNGCRGAVIKKLMTKRDDAAFGSMMEAWTEEKIG